MDNLKYGKQVYLVDNVKYDDVFVDDSGDSLVIGGTGSMFKAADTSLDVAYTTKGHTSGFFMSLNSRATVDDGEDFDFGFSVRRLDRLPGKGNKYPYNNIYTRPFYSRIKSLNVSSGSIAAADQELILDSLMSILKSDEPNKESKYFRSKKVYYVSVASGSNGTINITIDGVTTAVAATAANAAGLVAKLDSIAAVKDDILALAVSSSVVMITSYDTAFTFSVAVGANVTAVDKGIAIYGVDELVKTILNVDEDFMTVKPFKLISYDWTTAAAGVTSDSKLDFHFIDSNKAGSVYNFGGNTTIATAASTINSNCHDVIAVVKGSVLYLSDEYGSSSGYDLSSITYPYESELTPDYNVLNYKGVFPANTGEDLYRNMIGQYKSQYGKVQHLPDLNKEYAVLKFVSEGTAPHLSGSASGYETFKTRMDVYIPKDELENAFWDASGKTSGTALTLAGVINKIFSGSVV